MILQGSGRLLVFILLASTWAWGAGGTLRVKTDASAVDVYLDRKLQGSTPLSLPNVPAGAHELMLVKDGYQDHVQKVEVRAGETVKLFIVMKADEEPLPELPVEYPVMHRHALGFCVGKLTVSSDAVDYKSSNSHDAFHIPIREVQLVARSMGAMPGTSFAPNAFAGEAGGLWIEGPGRNYTFWVMEDDPEKVKGGILLDAYTQARTKQLYRLVSRLWNEALTARKKKQ